MSGSNRNDHDRHGHDGLADSKDKIEEILADLPFDIPIYLFVNKDQYNLVTKETSVLKDDGVFVAIGYTPNVDLALKLGVQLTPDGYIKQDQRHRTNLPGVYSAGDVEGGYKQIITAAGQGAGAAMTIFEDLMNPYWKKT